MKLVIAIFFICLAPIVVYAQCIVTGDSFMYIDADRFLAVDKVAQDRRLSLHTKHCNDGC